MTLVMRSVRVQVDEWDAAKEKAARRGETISDVVRRALTDYTTAPEAVSPSTTP